ncbi:MAG: GrpB family protein [Thermoleophilaceae bacterium]
MAHGDLVQPEVNVRAVVDYDPAWPEQFAAPARELRRALGSVALRIDHVGSTAVPGLAAKPIIDVQISAASFEPLSALREPIESCGFVWRANDDDLSRRYFRERPGRRRTHVHVRRAGSFYEQLNLLHRDYLRADPIRAAEYAAFKRSVAHLLLTDRQAYVEAKAPFVWETLARAHDWAQITGWEPEASDA